MLRYRKIFYCIVGVVSLALSVMCFCSEKGDEVFRHYYGGDAYSGIQNASADAGTNVYCLTKIVAKGFGSVLLVGGLALLATGLTIRTEDDFPGL